MDKNKERDNLLNFRMGNDQMPEDAVQLDFGEDFIPTDENINSVLSMLYYFKSLGMCDDAATEALYCFVDTFGGCVGWTDTEGCEDEE
jgi:hypothetical protein